MPTMGCLYDIDDTVLQVRDYSEMSKSIPRQAYTKKILEIVANIRKQKKEIENVLTESKGRQKEINNLQGRAERTFTAADEIMFKVFALIILQIKINIYEIWSTKFLLNVRFLQHYFFTCYF